jgi:hypothetical protein
MKLGHRLGGTIHKVHSYYIESNKRGRAHEWGALVDLEFNDQPGVITTQKTASGWMCYLDDSEQASDDLHQFWDQMHAYLGEHCTIVDGVFSVKKKA